MVTFLLTIPFTPTQIGLMRTASVMLEMSATWLSPLAMNKVGPLRAGLWSLNWQLFSCAAAVSLFLALLRTTPTISAAALVAGVVASRVGLWGFDLAVQILVQEGVEPAARGSFSAMEACVQNSFELCAYASTIVFARPEQFRWPVVMSAGAVGVASVALESVRGREEGWGREEK